MNFLRQRWKQKPQQWGPFSRVQSSLFHNLENIFGIDHQTCALALPCWGPGDQVNYGTSKSEATVFQYYKFEKNGLLNTVSGRGRLSFSVGVPTYPFSIIVVNSGCNENNVSDTADNICHVASLAYSYMRHGFYIAQNNENIFLESSRVTPRIIEGLQFRNNGKTNTLIGEFDQTNRNLYINGEFCGNNTDSAEIYNTEYAFFLGPHVDLFGPVSIHHETALYVQDYVGANTVSLLSDNPNALWQRVAPISYYFPVGGSGGTVFDVACLDGFNLNDAISRNAIFSAVANETLSLSSSPGNIGNFLSSTLSQISMTGSTSTRMILLGNVADSIGIGGVASALNAIVGLVSDSVSLSGSTTTKGVFQGSASDSVSFSDAVINSLITQGIINEVVNISDAASLGAFIDAIADDQITLSDGAVNVAALIAAIQDNINLSDSVTAILQALAAASDTINLSDLAAWGAVQQALALSGLSLTDSAAANLQMFAQSADSITFDDASHMTATFNVAVNDAVLFAETISKIALFQASVADSARFSATAMEVSTLPNGKVTVSFDIKIPGVGFDMKTATITFNLT